MAELLSSLATKSYKVNHTDFINLSKILAFFPYMSNEVKCMEMSYIYTIIIDFTKNVFGIPTCFSSAVIRELALVLRVTAEP